MLEKGLIDATNKAMNAKFIRDYLMLVGPISARPMNLIPPANPLDIRSTDVMELEIYRYDDDCVDIGIMIKGVRFSQEDAKGYFVGIGDRELQIVPDGDIAEVCHLLIRDFLEREDCIYLREGDRKYYLDTPLTVREAEDKAMEGAYDDWF